MEQARAGVEVNMGRQGRLVIPPALRRSLDSAEGDTLVARQEKARGHQTAPARPLRQGAGRTAAGG